jgi:hypothetical protein
MNDPCKTLFFILRLLFGLLMSNLTESRPDNPAT